jgi:hypothetical protein
VYKRESQPSQFEIVSGFKRGRFILWHGAKENVMLVLANYTGGDILVPRWS